MQVNDCILEATGGPTINDGLATFFGMTATENINDAEYRWLGEQGATASQLNDRWFELLFSAGLHGSLNDMKHYFWCVWGGVIPAPPANVVTHLGVPLTHGGGYLTYTPPP